MHNETEEGEEEDKDELIDGLEDTISKISSNKDADETNELLNMNFAQELNFTLHIDTQQVNNDTNTLMMNSMEQMAGAPSAKVSSIIPPTQPRVSFDATGNQ